MGDKYKVLEKDSSTFQDSTYQLLIEPRNKDLKKEGATYYTVVDSKLVRSGAKVKDAQIFYDTLEYHTLNDPSDDDTWGGQTTTDIVTFNPNFKPGEREKELAISDYKNNLNKLIEDLES